MLGKLSTPWCIFQPSIWFGTGKCWEVNRHTVQCTGLVFVILQLQQVQVDWFEQLDEKFFVDGVKSLGRRWENALCLKWTM